VKRLKALRRRWSVSAPRMTVRTHVPWPLRVGAWVLLLGVSAALGLWIYDAGRRFAGLGSDSPELIRLRGELATVTADRDRLQAAANATESRLGIERSTQQQLVNQVRSLEVDNARIQEDLAFFESLSTKGETTGLAIKRMVVERDEVPGHMRYKILVTQGGKQTRDFTGSLQLILTLQQGNKAVIINLPDNDPKADAKAFKLGFRRYQRLEGNLVIPEGAVLKQVQARILENGQVRKQQSLMFK
jgi:hypothetical protein